MTRRTRRSGFTLVELLVVIAIIAVLVSLTSAAVFRVLFKGPEINNRSDITGLSTAIGSFKEGFGVNVMPSKIILFEEMAMYDPATNPSVTPEERESRAFLGAMFGRRLQGQIDWNNDDVDQKGAAGRYELSGEQALVFFLGGAQVRTGPYGCLGFSKDPANPMANSGTTKRPVVAGETRYGPYYNFKSNRLVTDRELELTPSYVAVNTAPVRNGFFVYLDAFQVRGRKRPFVYFADKSQNNYQGYSYEMAGTDRGTATAPAVLVRPYFSAAGRPMNSGGFQILSAGPDGYFGDSSAWNPSNGTAYRLGQDDMTSFVSGSMKTAQE